MTDSNHMSSIRQKFMEETDRRAKEIQNANERMCDEYEKEFLEIQKKLELAEDENAVKNRTMHNLEQTANSQTAKITNLEKTIEENRRKAEIERQQFTTVQNQLKMAQSEISKKNHEIKTQQESINSLTSQVEACDKKVANSKENYKHLENRLLEEKNKSANTTKELKQAQLMIADHPQKMEELQKNNDLQTERIKNMKRVIEDNLRNHKRIVGIVEDELRKEQSQNAFLTGIMEKHEPELKELRDWKKKRQEEDDKRPSTSSTVPPPPLASQKHRMPIPTKIKTLGVTDQQLENQLICETDFKKQELIRLKQLHIQELMRNLEKAFAMGSKYTDEVLDESEEAMWNNVEMQAMRMENYRLQMAVHAGAMKSICKEIFIRPTISDPIRKQSLRVTSEVVMRNRELAETMAKITANPEMSSGEMSELMDEGVKMLEALIVFNAELTISGQDEKRAAAVATVTPKVTVGPKTTVPGEATVTPAATGPSKDTVPAESTVTETKSMSLEAKMAKGIFGNAKKTTVTSRANSESPVTVAEATVTQNMGTTVIREMSKSPIRMARKIEDTVAPKTTVIQDPAIVTQKMSNGTTVVPPVKDSVPAKTTVIQDSKKEATVTQPNENGTTVTQHPATVPSDANKENAVIQPATKIQDKTTVPFDDEEYLNGNGLPVLQPGCQYEVDVGSMTSVALKTINNIAQAESRNPTVIQYKGKITPKPHVVAQSTVTPVAQSIEIPVALSTVTPIAQSTHTPVAQSTVIPVAQSTVRPVAQSKPLTVQDLGTASKEELQELVAQAMKTDVVQPTVTQQPMGKTVIPKEMEKSNVAQTNGVKDLKKEDTVSQDAQAETIVTQPEESTTVINNAPVAQVKEATVTQQPITSQKSSVAQVKESTIDQPGSTVPQANCAVIENAPVAQATVAEQLVAQTEESSVTQPKEATVPTTVSQQSSVAQAKESTRPQENDDVIKNTPAAQTTVTEQPTTSHEPSVVQSKESSESTPQAIVAEPTVAQVTTSKGSTTEQTSPVAQAPVAEQLVSQTKEATVTQSTVAQARPTIQDQSTVLQESTVGQNAWIAESKDSTVPKEPIVTQPKATVPPPTENQQTVAQATPSKEFTTDETPSVAQTTVPQDPAPSRMTPDERKLAQKNLKLARKMLDISREIKCVTECIKGQDKETTEICLNNRASLEAQLHQAHLRLEAQTAKLNEMMATRLGYSPLLAQNGQNSTKNDAIPPANPDLVAQNAQLAQELKETRQKLEDYEKDELAAVDEFFGDLESDDAKSVVEYCEGLDMNTDQKETSDPDDDESDDDDDDAIEYMDPDHPLFEHEPGCCEYGKNRHF